MVGDEYIHMSKQVTVSDSVVESNTIVKPSESNSFGNVHGGELMKIMDEAAAISASRVAGNPCVTARISEVEFHTPIEAGDIVRVKSFVYETGNTSMNVFVRVFGEELGGDREQVLATTASFTFVAVDEDGNPVEAGDVTINTEEDKELVELAQD